MYAARIMMLIEIQSELSWTIRNHLSYFRIQPAKTISRWTYFSNERFSRRLCTRLIAYTTPMTTKNTSDVPNSWPLPWTCCEPGLVARARQTRDWERVVQNQTSCRVREERRWNRTIQARLAWQSRRWWSYRRARVNEELGSERFFVSRRARCPSSPRCSSGPRQWEG